MTPDELRGVVAVVALAMVASIVFGVILGVWWASW